MRCEGKGFGPDMFETFIDLAVDKALPEEAKQRLEHHLLRCAHCAHQMRALEQVRQMIQRAVPKAEVAPSYSERVQAKLHAHFAVRFPEAERTSPTQRPLPFPQDDRPEER